MIAQHTVVSIAFGALGVVVLGYLPISLFLYWLVKIRGGQYFVHNLVRDREISGFFGERPVEPWNGSAYTASMLFATLIMGIGFLLVYPATAGYLFELSSGQTSDTLQAVAYLETLGRPLFFGFLGAFLFTLQTTSRRFHASDLNPDAYFQVATRTTIALIVAAMFSMGLSLQLGQAQVPSTALNTIVYIATFVVGIFPDDGIRWIMSFARRYLPGVRERDEKQYDLQLLRGLNRWHAIRLNVEGIDNVHNMANGDIYGLIQRTRFSVPQIFDWVDQAVLLVHLANEDEFEAVQEIGVRGLSDFQVVYRNSSIRKALEKILGSNNADGAQRLDTLYATMQQTPSGDQIRLYRRYSSSYATDTFEHFNRGRAFAELGQHDKAIEQYDLALGSNPLNPMPMINRGKSRRILSQELELVGRSKEAREGFQQAISDFTKATELDPFSADAFFNRARIYMLVDRPSQAVNDYKEVLKLSDQHFAALIQCAAACQHPKIANFKESLKYLKRAQRLDGAQAESYVLEANAYRLLNERAKALEAFDRAIEIDADLPEVYHRRGQFYASGEPPRTAAAYQDFERAVELDASNPAEVYKDWGAAAYQAGEFWTAIGMFDEAIQANQSYALAYNMRGLANYAVGRPDRAVRDYTEILKKSPDYADAYVNRGIARSEMGENTEALSDLRRGIDLDPNLVIAYVNRGEVYRKMGDPQLAIADFAKAVRLQDSMFKDSPDTYKRSPIPHNNLGNLYIDQGEYLDAIEQFDLAIAIDARFAEAFNNRGLARQALGQLSTARNDILDAIRLDPLNPVYHFNRGLLNRELGDDKQAVRDFSQAIESDPDYEEAYLQRALVYRDQEDWPECRGDIERVLELNPDSQEAVELRAAIPSPA